MKAVILLALVSTASYGFSVPEVPADKPGEFVPATGFHIPNQPDGVSPRIIGGNEAAPHAHPHQVSLQLWGFPGYKHRCGGVIVGADKIITAAHCAKGQNIANMRVVAGEYDLFAVPHPHEQIRAVRSAFAHPLYNSSTIDYDFAVIRLSSPLTFNQNVSPINLASSEPKFGDCINTGWGCTNPNCSDSSSNPGKLQEVTIPIVSRFRCEQLYNGTGSPMVTGRMICAGAPNKGPCRGDSGGPLVCNGQLAGIVSWGNPRCAVSPQFPGVFANIDAARQWLDSQ